ncbi:hypothetical protein [Lichenifustis flavocetrariae]|uniref:Uncharacterized protein n=1 Tax=Lichenifustis flavocetrariae TaxID=2949735 RepID=A0AA42CQD6_9HYPH|nr:hypothetical protein [Lichenifustis flavocetrariae]MCW6511345.1 hypothetical protein [Lichenifustis flavocetrariae]
MLRDYPRMFGLLKSNRIEAFLPVFQYVEQPTSKTLGFESDFFPPCSPTSPGFAAVRQYGIKLVVAADVIYPRGQAMPPLDIDPLKTIIGCAGRENIYGVLSYDEPVHQGVSESDVQRVYQRVKAVDGTVPVLMVQAPMIADQPKFATAAGRNTYLQAVKIYSQYADIVGFDVYPVPREIAKVTSPDDKGAVVDHPATIAGYMAWLKRTLPGKRLMIVLQGFSYADEFDHGFLTRTFDAATIRAMAGPTAAQMTDMTRIAITGGADTVFWWGPSFVGTVSDPSWSAMTTAITTLKTKP